MQAENRMDSRAVTWKAHVVRLARCDEVVKGDEVDAMAGFECFECQSDSQVGCSVC